MERCGLKVQHKSHIYTPRMQKVWRNELTPPKWTPTLGVGVPTEFQCLENDFRGWNALDWTLSYTIGKLLKCKCLKWACMTHLNIYNTSYGQKKGRESKCQFDSQLLKVWNHFIYLCASGVPHIVGKLLMRATIFLWASSQIKNLHKKLWASKMARVLILGFPIWESRNKMTFGCSPYGKAQKILERGRWWLPKVQAMLKFVNLCMRVAHSCTKSVPTMH